MAPKKKETDNQMQERGFEYQGEFYPWYLTDGGKDLILIDRITGGMLPHEFFAAANDVHEQFRGPILLGLIATSVRHRHTDWSVERILRMTMELNLGDIEYIGSDDEEEAAAGPPASADGEDSPESSAKSNGSPAVPSEKASEIPA